MMHLQQFAELREGARNDQDQGKSKPEPGISVVSIALPLLCAATCNVSNIASHANDSIQIITMNPESNVKKPFSQVS